MPRSFTSAIAVLLLASALTAPAAAAQSAAQGSARKARPDLKITAGEVAVSGARVTGSFTISNKGGKKARATSTAVRIDGKRVRSIATAALAPGQTRQIRFGARIGGGRHVVSVCADRRGEVRERKERNNCRRLGRVTVASTSVPTDPIAYDHGVVFKVGKSPHEYWLHVPAGYDDSHRTPIRLVVMVHGCGAMAQDHVRFVTDYIPSATKHLLMAPGLGKDGQCWDPSADAAPLLASIADVKTHFNIDPKRVVLGGYSSGSTLAGQVAFRHAASFAGLFVLPGRPFWSDDNRAELMSGADWKLNVAWRAHKADEYYPIATLRADRRAMLNAGWPLAFSEVAGDHAYNQADLTYVFDKLSGWTAP